MPHFDAALPLNWHHGISIASAIITMRMKRLGLTAYS
jgi:hypothetical protein